LKLNCEMSGQSAAATSGAASCSRAQSKTKNQARRDRRKRQSQKLRYSRDALLAGHVLLKSNLPRAAVEALPIDTTLQRSQRAKSSESIESIEVDGHGSNEFFSFDQRLHHLEIIATTAWIPLPQVEEASQDVEWGPFQSALPAHVNYNVWDSSPAELHDAIPAAVLQRQSASAQVIQRAWRLHLASQLRREWCIFQTDLLHEPIATPCIDVRGDWGPFQAAKAEETEEPVAAVEAAQAIATGHADDTIEQEERQYETSEEMAYETHWERFGHAPAATILHLSVYDCMRLLQTCRAHRSFFSGILSHSQQEHEDAFKVPDGKIEAFASIR